MDSRYDAVVIGSGFGGSINALRLAQAGKSVLMIERGKRYPPGSFPRDTKRVNELLWRYPRSSGALQNKILVERMTEAMEKIAATYGGTFSPLPTWSLFDRIITVHSLGGCHLSDSPQQGVVSPQGEVHGYPGLYVADGSVIPTAIGFHSVMTLSAVSEQIAEAVVASYSN